MGNKEIKGLSFRDFKQLKRVDSIFDRYEFGEVLGDGSFG